LVVFASGITVAFIGVNSVDALNLPWLRFGGWRRGRESLCLEPMALWIEAIEWAHF
jgi:hypothetical protein